MQPVIFRFAELRSMSAPKLGVGPSLQGTIPLPMRYLGLAGMTKDSTGAALSGCTVDLFRSSDKALADSVISDGSGNYEFRSASLSTQYKADAYKAGNPDVAGTSVNTLVGTGA